MSKISPIRRPKREATKKMDCNENILLNASEFIKGKLYFVSMNTTTDPKSTQTVLYFTLNRDLKYDSFYRDFGPLNLAMIYHYCVKLKRKLNNPTLSNKKIVHYVKDCTDTDGEIRVNSAFLIGAFAIINLDYTAEEAYETLNQNSTKEYIKFRDASVGEPYTLTLLDCLRAIKRALDQGFFNFDDFDFMEYEYYERVENGDFNWIVPEKFIAFCGPQDKATNNLGDHKPETYFPYFRRHNVSTIVRLNKKVYDSNVFVEAGFEHKDLYFVDGGTPSERILQQFISCAENAEGVVAVHCKAGLGRTGSLIGCYIMKHYKFTAEEAIAWIRICRPGSIIGHQQSWLQEKQKQMWDAGEVYRKKNGMSEPIVHKIGIYALSDAKKEEKHSNPDNVRKIAEEVDHMELHDSEEEYIETQGDKLNQIKLQRSRMRSIVSSNNKQTERICKVTTNTMANTVRTPGKVVSTTKTVGSKESSRVVTKRIDGHPTRRATKKKISSSTSTITVTTTQTSVVEKRQVKKEHFQNGVDKEAKNQVKNEEINNHQNKARKRVLAREREMARRAKMLRRSHPIALTYNKIEKTTETVEKSTLKVNKTM